MAPREEPTISLALRSTRDHSEGAPPRRRSRRHEHPVPYDRPRRPAARPSFGERCSAAPRESGCDRVARGAERNDRRPTARRPFAKPRALRRDRGCPGQSHDRQRLLEWVIGLAALGGAGVGHGVRGCGDVAATSGASVCDSDDPSRVAVRQCRAVARAESGAGGAVVDVRGHRVARECRADPGVCSGVVSSYFSTATLCRAISSSSFVGMTSTATGEPSGEM